MVENPLTLSVLVTSYNQRESVVRLVGQLLEQDFDPVAYEILVLDDASTDDTTEWLRSVASDRIRPLINERNMGRAVTRNLGIRAAHGRIIVMVDGDHTIGRDFLSLHASRHQNQICAIVGKSDYAFHPDFIGLNTYIDGAGAVKLPSNLPLPGRYFTSANCSFPVDLIERAGLLDERFTAWGGEDLEFGMRIVKAGIPIYAETRARAVHHHFRTLNDFLHSRYIFGREGIPWLLSLHPELFFELKLDRILSAPGSNVGFSPHRIITRILLSAPFYRVICQTACALRRHKLPRVVYDYLVFRQYAYGYLDSMKSNRG